MSKRDNIGLIIVSIVAIILMIGLLFKTYDILSNDYSVDGNQVDSATVKQYYEEIAEGPAEVELDHSNVKEVVKPIQAERKETDIEKEVQSLPKIKATDIKAKHVYIIVTGAFSNKTNANKWKEKLKAKAYKADVYYQSDRGLYLVYVNKFDSREKASEYSQNLKVKGIDNHIKPI